MIGFKLKMISHNSDCRAPDGSIIRLLNLSYQSALIYHQDNTYYSIEGSRTNFHNYYPTL